jgi:MFS family permease
VRSASIPREILALAAVAFCVALGFGVVTPAIPLFAQQFGVGATAAGAVVSAFAFMRLVFGPFGGRLVDKLGERVALVSGLGVVAVSSLLAGLAQNYPQLLVLRAVGGIGSTVFTVAATSLVIRVAAAQLRGRAMSVYQSGFLLGGIVGPAAGGAVLGLSLRAPFFFYAATLALACAVGLVFMRAMRQPAGNVDLAATDPVIPPMRLRAALRMPAYIAALASNLAVGFALFGMRSALVPLLIVDEIGAAPSWVGWSFFVSAIVQTGLMFPAGKLVDTVGRRLPLIGGAAITAVGLAMLGIDGLLPVSDLANVMVAMVVLGVGGALLGPVPGALLGDVVTGRGGTVVAVSQMVGDVGAVLGPLAAGVLVEHVSYGAAFGLGAVVVAAAGLFGFVLPRTLAGQPLEQKQGSA